MKSLSRENQADIIEAFNSTSRYLDDLLNIDNIYFDQMVDWGLDIYPMQRKTGKDAEEVLQHHQWCPNDLQGYGTELN